MRAARRILRHLPTATLLIALVALAAVAVGPRVGAFRTVTILTGSMAPSIEPGDLIVSTPQPARSVEVGDVLTFHAPVEGSPLVTHRVSEVVEAGAHPQVRTKGDANRGEDPWVARIADDTVWRQRAVLPNVGHAIQFARRPVAKQLLLYGSLVAFLALGLRSIWSLPAERVR